MSSVMNLNLLPSKAKFQAAKIKLQAKVRTIMIVVAGIWVFMVAALMVANIIAKIKINQVTAASENVQKNYLEMQESIVTSQRFKYKTKMVGEVLNKRFEYGRAFEMVTTMFPVGIVVKNYDLRQDGIFEIRGETQGKENIDRLEDLAESVNSSTHNQFSNVALKSLVYKGNVWSFTMEVKLK